MTEFLMPDFADPAIWISLLTLCFLEIVLGIDNIIFISIVAGKLPEAQQRKARNTGLLLAMVFRVLLLLCINWIIGLKEAVFTLPHVKGITDAPIGLSWKDLILIAGGIFLIVKSTLEIHHKLVKKEEETKKGSKKASMSVAAVLGQIILVDAVFSFDSILTAVGLVENVIIMIIAVIVSIGVMMLFAGPVTRIINKQPTLQMLALSFLVVIGVVLVASGFHQEVAKSIIYSCLAFSLGVELLNIKLRGRQKNIELNDGEEVISQQEKK
ncbi:TerC family protein [Pseudoflavitalea sp. G-6-1-2]|uniref:TerC family protein n=1 Tax=Pseudoflavitalea sp. G-6-1-2 TaxID=2728841 RepID=UPI00146F41FD|nr:TerC family protein [Pseudoflavitalea sp. G-6-1-2]NML23511.1 TerC family protein [Pseudoflavitalea sp. G-6-1-2]